ncbi:MAG: hypothetical protein ABII72_00645 [Parcubacteria group bacterium]
MSIRKLFKVEVGQASNFGPFDPPERRASKAPDSDWTYIFDLHLAPTLSAGEFLPQVFGGVVETFLKPQVWGEDEPDVRAIKEIILSPWDVVAWAKAYGEESLYRRAREYALWNCDNGRVWELAKECGLNIPESGEVAETANGLRPFLESIWKLPDLPGDSGKVIEILHQLDGVKMNFANHAKIKKLLVACGEFPRSEEPVVAGQPVFVGIRPGGEESYEAGARRGTVRMSVSSNGKVVSLGGTRYNIEGRRVAVVWHRGDCETWHDFRDPAELAQVKLVRDCKVPIWPLAYDSSSSGQGEAHAFLIAIPDQGLTFVTSGYCGRGGWKVTTIRPGGQVEEESLKWWRADHRSVEEI